MILQKIKENKENEADGMRKDMIPMIFKDIEIERWR
jgi:hypothetical protein